MAVELQHSSRRPGLASLDRIHQRTWSRPGRPGELTRDAEVVTRVRPLADARDPNRVAAGHTPEVDKERPG